jgi:hypothetical protein
LVSSILFLCARAKVAVDLERVAFSGVVMAQQWKTLRVYETRLSGTTPVLAPVGNCPTPPRGFAEVDIVAYDGLFRFGGIIARYY